MANNNNNNNWKRIGGFSRTGTQNYVRTNDAAMGGTTFGSTDVSNNVGNTTLRIGNNAGVVYINGDIDMSGGVNVVAPINRIRNVRDPIADQDVATKFYVDDRIAVISGGVNGYITGPTGREGPPGIGIAGTNGSDGPTGHTGCTGPLGATGSSFGVKGPTGEKGVPGSTGANGAAGATGPIGPNGEKGEQGTQGTQGIQGSNGTILWLNPDGDSPTNQLITDSYLLSKVPINASIRTVGPISVSATYGNVNKIIPASRFYNTAIEVSTLAVIPSGVWVLNLYANVPSTSDANQVALYAAVFMISGTTNQPSPDSLIIETKDGGDAGYYPPRAAYLPDHVKYIGKSWASTENVLTSNTDTANKGVPIDGTSRKLYKLEIPVEFITLKDAAGNRENVYVQLQIYIRNTKEANQTANVSLYFQTDATTNETTYSYLQTTFGAVGIQGIRGSTGSTGSKGENGLIGPAGPAGATGSDGPTGIAGPVGPRGSQGPTGVTGPGGSSNSYGVQYAVQYRGNQSTGDTDNSGNFRGDTNFRYIPTGYINRLTDATAGSVVLNDIACNSIHSPVYVQDTSIVVGTGTTRPRTYIRGGELVNSGGSAEQSNYVVLASGTDTTNGNNSKTAVSVNDITNGIKMIHNYGTKKVSFQVHDENKASGTVGLQFDLNGSAVLGNVSAAQDQFCIVNSSGAAGVGGITAAQLSASTHTALNRMLHVRGNVMVGSDPGGVNAASNAMVLLNKSTTTPSTPISGYPGVYHRQIASGEVTALGGATNSIATSGEGLGFISPNFITFQTGSSLQNNSIVINQAGVVSVTGRTNLNGAVTVNKNFATVETHDNLAPVMDISGTLSVTTGAPDFTDVPRIKLISRGIAANSAIPAATTSASSNEIRGVSSNSSTSGFLRLSAQTPAHSCIDLIGLNTHTSAYNNAVRISTGGNERMIVNGSGNVGIGTNAPTVRLDVNGEGNILSGLTIGSSSNSSLVANSIASKLAIYHSTDARIWIRYGTSEGLLIGNNNTGSFIYHRGTVGEFQITCEQNVPMKFKTTNTDRMTILGDGKVGIGTVGPNTALDVNGRIRAIGGIKLGANSTTTDDMTENSSLDINNSSIARTRFICGSNVLTLGMSTAESFFWNESNTQMAFGTSNNRRMTITNTGNVGIGIEAATSLLHVAGAAKITGNLDMSSSGKIVNLVNPTAAQEAATKGYVDGRFSNASITGTLNVSGTTTFGNKIIFKSGVTNVDEGGHAVSQIESPGGWRLEWAAAFLWYAGGVETMHLASTGLGIGTRDIEAPLHVASKRQIPTGVSAFYSYVKNTPFWDARWTGGGNYNVSIISGGDLWVKGNYIWVSSDKRIKRNIRDIEGTTALSQVRKIRPKVYNYIDHTKGTQDIYGFIAQDTEDVITYSSNIVKDYIPNFYCKGDIQTIDQTNHIYEISTENEFKFEKVIDTSGNEISNYKIKLYDDKNKDYICTVIHRIDAKTIRVKCDKEYIFSTIEEYKNTVFIYGQEVNDFYNLDRNAIFTVATAALQEVDRQQQADKARIAELENQVSNLEATVGSQQSLINDILERLKSNGM